MLPPDLREWLPEGHLAEQVSDLVDCLDLTVFYAPHELQRRLLVISISKHLSVLLIVTPDLQIVLIEMSRGM